MIESEDEKLQPLLGPPRGRSRSFSIGMGPPLVVDRVERGRRWPRELKQRDEEAYLTFGEVFKSEVMRIMRNRPEAEDEGSRRSPLPFMFGCMLFLVILLVIAMIWFASTLISFGALHLPSDSGCPSKLASWSFIFGILINVDIVVWIVSQLSLNWLFKGAFHLMSTLASLWLIVGSVWLLYLNGGEFPEGCSVPVYRHCKIVIIVFWCVVGAFMVPLVFLYIQSLLNRFPLLRFPFLSQRYS